ncbi:MAG: hypothetical protein DHS20C14_08810 [Phycisphaeraceae bacterium]|nr:MAG: hypothetical protein DHS20C14_08810 [Phycisphaeraceae bacterium]
MPKTPPAKTPDDAPAPDALSYEDAVDALEAIVEKIESGEIGLGESMAEYERGVALIARCRAVLDQAEQKITELDLGQSRGQSGANRGSGSSAGPDRTD